MEDIELVIKIPRAYYELVIEKCLDPVLLNAFKNGTPLSKGHGDLIDSQELIEKWDNLSVRGRTEFDQVIMCMSPIIKADTESEG